MTEALQRSRSAQVKLKETLKDLGKLEAQQSLRGFIQLPDNFLALKPQPPKTGSQSQAGVFKRSPVIGWSFDLNRKGLATGSEEKK
ncbi:hypothetical protein RRG08_059666 [Elysia crispata]|uniref:Uncharacterized protein n=1 Tax=Elysia crispata TaxID=231223 RepID=A0AAE1EAK9_9GAST|nr:hypothetical protein RRG08_059666 [Elysia crispata]